MSANWTTDQLDRVAAAEELRITTPDDSGGSRSAIPIWVVRHGDALYVRSYRGSGAVWYRRATEHEHGHISAGGVDAEVGFSVETDAAVNAEVDHAYREKYGRYGPRFIDPMTSPAARATTLKLSPLTSTDA